MSQPDNVVGYLLFRKLIIENANSLSGQLIYGTPAITGIKGAFHALSRKLMSNPKTSDLKVLLQGVMIACHDYDIRAQRSSSYRNYHFYQQKPCIFYQRDYVKLTNNQGPSIIESAQCTVTMSFVVEVTAANNLSDIEKEQLKETAMQIIQSQRLAGGNIRPFSKKSKVLFIEKEDIDDVGYQLPKCTILVDASEVMVDLCKQNPSMTATELIIDACTNHFTPKLDDAENIIWEQSRITSDYYGWIVPIMVGYHGISPIVAAGKMKNSRTDNYENQYVEAVYSLGRWVNPHQYSIYHSIESAFWHYNYDASQSTYLVSNQPTISN